MTEEEKQKAYQILNSKVEAVLAALKECEQFADEHGLEFSFDPAYGMGGWYIGKNYDDKNFMYREKGWHPSSHSC